MFPIISAILFINSVISVRSNIYHVSSRIVFHPDSNSTYFGYSVVLSNSSRTLIVGAPKAVSRVKDSIAPGQVLTCRLTNLDVQNITCYPLGLDDSEHDKSIRRFVNVKDFFRDDMWYGATIATAPDGKLFVCAPRWAEPYMDKHVLANGACYVETKRRGITLTPLKDRNRMAWRNDGTRKEYGDYNNSMNFYAHGQVGMSIKVTENNSVIIGAPGLLQWTGGIVDYRFNASNPNSSTFIKQPVAIPYYTMDLGPDDYLGYSVESGKFERNGRVLYVAGAPRSKYGLGQVLVFEPPIRERDPLNIRAKVQGSQLGSYFGASLACLDINKDGLTDLLVGAPNFVTKDPDITYDQGAVFVYLTELEWNYDTQTTTIHLKEAGYVTGSGKSGARFGTVIAPIGYINDDGWMDVAIGAPWENDGLGAVYIYLGTRTGLQERYSQRITDEGARGFGISISRGVDVDSNFCEDLAVGAHNSATAYLFRCIPELHAKASILADNFIDLHENTTGFEALFCVTVEPWWWTKRWNHVKLDMRVKITVDIEYERARTTSDYTEFRFTLSNKMKKCDEHFIEIEPNANLTEPITLTMDVEQWDPSWLESPTFNINLARFGIHSNLHEDMGVMVIKDCGRDTICNPNLELSLEPFTSEYVPGSSDRLGIKMKVLNKAEPAHDGNVTLHLPLSPRRIPSTCSLDGLILFCGIRIPLERNKSQEWDIEVDYTLQNTHKQVINFEAKVKAWGNKNNATVKQVNITIVPKAEFDIIGKNLQNSTINITRDRFDEAGNVSFVHYFEISNLGPSDWLPLEAVFKLPKNVTLSHTIKGCKNFVGEIACGWSVPANTSIPVVLSMKYNLSKYGSYLEELTTFNATTTLSLFTQKPKSFSVTTTLFLEPAKPIWPFIVVIAVSTIIGFLLLAGIVYGLYRYGFFSRTRHEEIKRRKLEEEETSPDEDPGCSTSPPPEVNESTQELLCIESDCTTD